MAFEKQPRVLRISRKGEVVIPADVRRELGLEQGGRVLLQLLEGKLVLEPTVGLGTALWGKYKPLPGAPSTEELLDDLDEAGEV